MLMSIYYIFLFIISEFRLEKLKFLSSYKYFKILVLCLATHLIVYFIGIRKDFDFLITLTLSTLMCSYLCRTVIWGSDLNRNQNQLLEVAVFCSMAMYVGLLNLYVGIC